MIVCYCQHDYFYDEIRYIYFTLKIKVMKKSMLLWIVSFMIISFGFYACEKDFTQEEMIEKKGSASKGGKGGGGKGKGGGGNAHDDVKYGDLYGDLLEIEINEQGIPRFDHLTIYTEEGDPVPGQYDYISVKNPRQKGVSFTFTPVRNADGSLNANHDPITINLDPQGFMLEDEGYSILQYYNAEGEMLPAVLSNAYPVEMGRLNLVRSPDDVKERRMYEVINNFGDGTVARVVRDYCGRLFMIRTEESGLENKPIDSPLENLAVYYELMTNGFSREASNRGLEFLIDPLPAETPEEMGGGFNMHFRLDGKTGVYAYNLENENDILITSDYDSKQLIANLAAAAISAASDKFGELKLIEIILINQFFGIPDATSIFPTEKMDYYTYNPSLGIVEKKVRSFINYSCDEFTFEYSRDKFSQTLVSLFNITYVDDGTGKLEQVKTPVGDPFTMEQILQGEITGIGVDPDRYDSKEIRTGAFGFANQADDYVQALVCVHDNETTFVWIDPTPTWGSWADYSADKASFYSPFVYDFGEINGNRPVK